MRTYFLMVIYSVLVQLGLRKRREKKEEEVDVIGPKLAEKDCFDVFPQLIESFFFIFCCPISNIKANIKRPHNPLDIPLVQVSHFLVSFINVRKVWNGSPWDSMLNYKSWHSELFHKIKQKLISITNQLACNWFLQFGCFFALTWSFFLSLCSIRLFSQ